MKLSSSKTLSPSSSPLSSSRLRSSNNSANLTSLRLQSSSSSFSFFLASFSALFSSAIRSFSYNSSSCYLIISQGSLTLTLITLSIFLLRRLESYCFLASSLSESFLIPSSSLYKLIFSRIRGSRSMSSINSSKSYSLSQSETIFFLPFLLASSVFSSTITPSIYKRLSFQIRALFSLS